MNIPYNLIYLKNLRRLSLFDLDIPYFNYPFKDVKLVDEDDFFQLLIEECTIHNFPKQLTDIHENFLIYNSDCDFKNYSDEELKEFHLRFPANAD